MTASLINSYMSSYIHLGFYYMGFLLHGIFIRWIFQWLIAIWALNYKGLYWLLFQGMPVMYIKSPRNTSYQNYPRSATSTILEKYTLSIACILASVIVPALIARSYITFQALAIIAAAIPFGICLIILSKEPVSPIINITTAAIMYEATAWLIDIRCAE